MRDWRTFRIINGGQRGVTHDANTTCVFRTQTCTGFVCRCYCWSKEGEGVTFTLGVVSSPHFASSLARLWKFVNERPRNYRSWSHTRHSNQYCGSEFRVNFTVHNIDHA